MEKRIITLTTRNDTYEINEEYDDKSNKITFSGKGNNITFSGEIRLDNSKESLRAKYLPKINNTPTIKEILKTIETEEDEMIEIESYSEVMSKYGIDLY